MLLFCFLLLSVVCVILFLDLWDVLMYQITAPIQGDARDYMTVGRGMLNGVFLIDGRPPGMGLLFALSLLVSGDERFMQFLQAMALAGIPLLTVVLAYRTLKDHAKHSRIFGILVACIFGLLFAMFCGDRSGRVQTESYGAFFTLCYIAVILWDQQRLSNFRVALASVFMLLAYGLKEPFVIILAACALLVLREKKTYIRGFLLPLGISILLGILVMACIGRLTPYITIILRETLVHRIQGVVPAYARGSLWGLFSGPIPFWARGFLVEILFKNLSEFSWALSRAVLSIFVFLPFFLASTHRKKLVLLLTAGILLLCLALYSGKIFLILFALPEQSFSFTGPLSIALFVAALFTVKEGLKEASRQNMKVFVADIGLTIGVLYLTAFTVAMGVFFYSNHFAFAVPIYITLFILFLRQSIGSTNILSRSISFPIICLIIVAGIRIPSLETRHEKEKEKHLPNNRTEEAIIATAADAMLTACNIDQFLTLGSNPAALYSRTKHSPLGPDHTLAWSYGERFTSQWLRDKFLSNIDSASIIIDTASGLTLQNAAAQQRIREQFTSTAPACAKPYLPLDPYIVLFRKE